MVSHLTLDQAFQVRALAPLPMISFDSGPVQRIEAEMMAEAEVAA